MYRIVYTSFTFTPMRSILATIVLFFICSVALCQEQQRMPIYLGPIGSYSFGSPVSINRELGAVNIFTTGGKGISWDNSVGGGLRAMLPTLFSEKFGLIGTASYTKGSGTFKSIDFTYKGHPVDFKIISNYQTVELSSLASYALSSKWFIDAGLYGSVRVASDLSQYIEITDTSHFGDGTKEETAAFGDQLATSRIHYGAEIGIGGRFPVSNVLSIVAGTFTRFDFGEIARGFSASAISGGATLGVVFDLDPPEGAKEISSKEPILRTSVFFTVGGVSSRLAASNRSDTLRERYVAIVPSIGFTDGKIASSVHLLSKAEAATFDVSLLDRKAIEICYSELLNVIGKRLADLPQETVALSSSLENNSQFIKDYLQSIWNIQGSRIELKKGNDQAVLIGGSNKLLSPLINSWVDEYRQTPDITIDKLISSSRGVKQWTLSVLDGDTKIATYSNLKQASEDARTSLAERSIDTSVHVFHALLMATDSLGTTSEASDSIRIVPSQASTSSKAISRTYIILANDLGSQTSWSSLLLKKIADALTEDQVVSIRGLYASKESKASYASKALLEELQGRKAKQMIIQQEAATPATIQPLGSAVEITITGDK
jgi:hypothetical protein